MRKLRAKLLILVIAATIGSAFTASSRASHLNTYIPVLKGAGFTWVQITPSNPLSNYTCVSGSIQCSEFTGSSAPADNTYPSGFSNEGHVYEAD